MSDALHMWVIYERPQDYPHGFVARLHLAQKGETAPTMKAFFGPTLESVREQLPPGLVSIARDPRDEPQIVETWL